MLPIAYPQIMVSAPIPEPTQLENQFLMGRAPRHHENTVARPALEFRQVLERFFRVENGSDNKFELVFSARHEGLHDVGSVAPCFVVLNPFARSVADWR